MKKLLTLAAILISLSTFAQVTPLQDTTIVGSSSPATPTYRYQIGANGLLVYRFLNGTYQLQIDSKYLRANFAPITGGGYVPTSRIISTNSATGLYGGGNLVSNLTLYNDTTKLQTIANLYPFSDLRYFSKAASDARYGTLSQQNTNTSNIAANTTAIAGKQSIGNYITALTGDGIASGPGNTPFTLATVNANTGSFGTSSNVPTITYNGKGLATSVANTPILIAESQVTNLVSDLATITNNLTVNIKYPMSYIANATTANVRDSEGDILVVPATGKYLTAYSKFNRGLGDAGAAVIVGKFSTDTTGNDWGSEFLISANIGLQNVLSVSLFASSSTTYACYFNVKNSTSDNRLYRSISTSSGAAGTWSAATQIVNDGAYDDILNAVVRTVNSGRIIIPVATTPISGPINVWSCYAKYSDDGGTTWSNSNTISPATTLGGVEPVIVQLSGNNLLMTMRTQSNWNWFSNSTDNGATWGTPYQSTLPSLYSPTQMINIGGKLLAGVNANISGNVRNPISLYKSLNNGATWTLVTNIEFGNNSHYEYSYPSFTVSNGYLLVSYYEYVDNIMCNQKFTKIKISDLAL
jgi:predicted neuraminidase